MWYKLAYDQDNPSLTTMEFKLAIKLCYVDSGNMLHNCEEKRKHHRQSVAPNRPLPYALQCLTALQPKSQLLLSDIHMVSTDWEACLF